MLWHQVPPFFCVHPVGFPNTVRNKRKKKRRFRSALSNRVELYALWRNTNLCRRSSGRQDQGATQLACLLSALTTSRSTCGACPHLQPCVQPHNSKDRVGSLSFSPAAFFKKKKELETVSVSQVSRTRNERQRGAPVGRDPNCSSSPPPLPEPPPLPPSPLPTLRNALPGSPPGGWLSFKWH